MSVSDPSFDNHWNANVAPVRPSASAMPSVDAVSVSPACAVPEMVGAPVAGEFGRACTSVVAALVNASPFPASSVKLTRTFSVAPTSESEST